MCFHLKSAHWLHLSVPHFGQQSNCHSIYFMHITHWKKRFQAWHFYLFIIIMCLILMGLSKIILF